MEHVVKGTAKVNHKNGHNTAQNILNYYRSRNRIAETQRQLWDKIGNLNLDISNLSIASYQVNTNEFAMLYDRLSLAKEVWSDAKQKQEHIQNIQLPEGHPLMVIKKCFGSDDKIKFKTMVKKMMRTNSQDNQ